MGGETHYLAKKSLLPPYLAYPRFLLGMDISETSKLVYVLLLDRARLSMRNDGWENEQGHVYIYYPIDVLVKDVRKSEMTIKNALAALEKKGLIVRQHQGVGRANKIYVKVQKDTCLPVETENEPTGTENEPTADRKLSGNNNYINNTKKEITKKYDCEEGDSL